MNEGKKLNELCKIVQDPSCWFFVALSKKRQYILIALSVRPSRKHNVGYDFAINSYIFINLSNYIACCAKFFRTRSHLIEWFPFCTCFWHHIAYDSTFVMPISLAKLTFDEVMPLFVLGFLVWQNQNAT